MLDRRSVTALLGSGALCGPAWAANPLSFYASAGPSLTLYGLDVTKAELTPRGTVLMPANLQYAWPHPSLKVLYVVASNTQPGSGPMGATGTDKNHYALAFRVDPANGALTPLGQPRLLPARPLHVTTNPTGTLLFVAYNLPSRVTVHRLETDGTIGEPVEQASNLDFGIYAHQVRVTPGGKTLVLCSRGNDADGSKPEDPGHIEVFSITDGKLANLQSLAPNGQGLGFGPRHLDFHPNGRFIYVSLERQNSICVYALNPDGTLGNAPLFVKSALVDSNSKSAHPAQTAGPIHVHPNGHFVYQTNRASGASGNPKVWSGGENSVAVWSINQKTGEPTRIQNADAHGFELRTFTIDPSGKVLIAASTIGLTMPDGSKISAGLTVYRIGADGKLTFARKYDTDTSAGVQFWCGLLTMA